MEYYLMELLVTSHKGMVQKIFEPFWWRCENLQQPKKVLETKNTTIRLGDVNTK